MERMKWPRALGATLVALTRLCCFLLAAAWICGQAYRDLYWITGILFYIPTPVVFVLALISSIDALVRRLRAQSLVLIVTTVATCCFLMCVENRIWKSPEPISAIGSSEMHLPGLRMVHWNVFRGALGWPAMRKTLERYDADLYVISEIPTKLDASPFPDHEFLQLGEMAVFSRGSVSLVDRLSRGDMNAYWITWQSSSGPIDVFVADVSSSVRIHRDPLLQELRSLIQDKSPDLIVGDLNSPRRSRALCPLPEDYHHAYDSVGRGWSYTWPTPVPVFAIDQCIHKTRLKPAQYQLVSSRRSDHRIQVFDFQVD